MAPSKKSSRLRDAATVLVRLENELALSRAEFDRLAVDDGAVETHADFARRSTRLLEIAAAIVRLENEIGHRRAEFDRLLRGASASTASAQAEPLLLRPLARTSSLLLRVQSVLDLVSPGSMNAHDVAAQIREPLDSVRAALSKLVARESATRVAPGVYRSLVAGHRSAAGEDD